MGSQMNVEVAREKYSVVDSVGFRTVVDHDEDGCPERRAQSVLQS